jgi:hypothetical protein
MPRSIRTRLKCHAARGTLLQKAEQLAEEARKGIGVCPCPAPAGPWGGEQIARTRSALAWGGTGSVSVAISAPSRLALLLHGAVSLLSDHRSPLRPSVYCISSCSRRLGQVWWWHGPWHRAQSLEPSSLAPTAQRVIMVCKKILTLISYFLGKVNFLKLKQILGF